jgi:MoaA/NifB/PqqE/SkfB family radical SAM enzyme
MISSKNIETYNSYACDINLLRDNKTFFINWAPDFFCNYSCSYCWPNAHNPKRTHLEPKILINSLSNLKNKIIELGYQNIYLSFAGGEPTLVPNFLDLVKAYSKDKIIKQMLHINTNLSHGVKWWTEFLKITKNIESISISASWHRESVGDIENSRQKFLDVYELFKANKKSFKITIVMPPSQFDDVYSDALFFRRNKIPTLIRIERKYINGLMSIHPDYTKDMIENIIDWNEEPERKRFIHKEGKIIKKYSDVEQAIAFGETNYFDWLCYGGTSSVVISPNGDIKRGHTCIDDKIGNITEEYFLWNEPKKCITKRCGCSADMNRPKIKI